MPLIGDYFRAERERQGKSLFELAMAAEVLPQTIARLEKTGSCTLNKAVKIATALGIKSIPLA